MSLKRNCLTICNIAKAELQVFFYSPIAWIILVIFTFQAGLIYTESFESFMLGKNAGASLYDLTAALFTSMRGLFSLIQSSLYLYIPLLTMGVMSRELSSGSIKLLYSSPITNFQIIMGKYLALVSYASVIVGLLGVFCLFSGAVVKDVDWPLILSGMLGLFLLTCAYAAIGLFMSSLTSYTVVAAMGTLAILSLLAYVKTLWQDIAFVRDVTYWLAISGRSDTFIVGLITTEDLLYFFMVAALFLSFTIIRMQSSRMNKPRWQTVGQYAVVVLIVALVGYVSSLPAFKKYYDVTHTRKNTLTRSSQAVLSKLDDELTIDTYVNMFEPNYMMAVPKQYKDDMKQFERYLRFKPGIKVNYHYYYQRGDFQLMNPRLAKLPDAQLIDTLRKINNWNFPIVPYSQLRKDVDLSGEGFRFVRRLKRANGTSTFLRLFNDNNRNPSETEITAAIKRLVMELPLVGFVKGHGERQSDSHQDRGYNMIAQEKTYRYALINQGFDFTPVTLDQAVPAKVRILVIAEPRSAYTEIEQANLRQYIARGGNLIVAGDPGKREFTNALTEQLGVQLQPGMLVKPSQMFQPDLLLLRPTLNSIAFSYHLESMLRRGMQATMPGTSALQFDPSKGFMADTLFRSDSAGWNEQETFNFIDDSLCLNPAAGEAMGRYPTVLALSRTINGKVQKILVTGDADWLSNGELAMHRNNISTSNFPLINATFFWMSDGEVPIDMRRPVPIDSDLLIGKGGWAVASVLLKWVLPGLLILAGVLIWLRRRGR
ncbi:Gldg family protein [Paraflavitalea pollutisoli]|uniref:Gldg family protein n=1 Tax=Paraflavitalea pollutisoli TaxID=3034143 RepID=UPI0023EBF1E4|nr:Gldg family protein [Paraflavitalea sp. H1-2-19X]